MSKMSQLNFALQEQAEELGFSTVQEALDNGYEVDYENGTLKDPQETAHEAWLKEKEDLLEEMRCSVGVLERHNYFHEQEVMERAIKFIEEAHE